jgi:hypothetical protein
MLFFNCQYINYLTLNLFFMKKTILTAALALAAIFGTNSYAQTSSAQLGVKGGINFANFTGDADGAKAKVGFNLGLTVDYKLAASVYLLSGLEYTLKGCKVEESGASVSLGLGYIQLPVHIGYKTEISQGTNLVLHAGPYFAYAAKGTLKSGGVSVNWFDENVDDIFKPKRFDAGLGIGAGLEFGKIAVGLGVDYGLLDIDKSSDGSLRNINTSLSVGYKF